MSRVRPINVRQQELLKPAPMTPFMQNLYNGGSPGSKPLTSYLNEVPVTEATGSVLGKYSGSDWQLGQPDVAANFSDSSVLPDINGDWMDGAKIGLGVAEVGLGVWNALEQSKMNKFMRGYYGDQMKMQRADFANNAKSANQSLEQQQKTALSAQGFGFDSAENKAGTASHMDKWGVKETF